MSARIIAAAAALLTTLISTLSTAAAAQVQSQPVPLHARGAPVQVSLLGVSNRAVGLAKGELLAASADSLWLLSNGGLLSLPRDRVGGVRIDRGGKYGVRYAVKRAAWFGVVAGVVLTGACLSVEDAGGQCIIVGPFSVGVSALAGVIAGAFLSSERHLTIREPSVDALRPWSRFPQGLPKAFPRGAVIRQ